MRPNAKGAEVALARYGIVPERIELLTTGHINETWYVADAANEWLLQWLNHGVFPQARAVQANMEVVLAHLAGKDARRSLTPALRPAADGALCLETDAGLWRVFAWLPDREVRTRPGSLKEAEAAGQALAVVLAQLSSLDGAALHPVHEAFHDLATRTANFRAAVANARRERQDSARALIDRVNAELPEREAAAPDAGAVRVLHGDPKFSNFLLPGRGGGAPALVDWDTVMIGPLAWDLGDFLRSAASLGDEDDPARASVDDGMLRAGAGGFFAGLGEALAEEEIRACIAAPAHMSFMLGVRFLTDHLDGDHYFRVRQPGQNLARAEAQFRLAAAFDDARPVLASVLASALAQG